MAANQISLFKKRTKSCQNNIRGTLFQIVVFYWQQFFRVNYGILVITTNCYYAVVATVSFAYRHFAAEDKRCTDD